MLRKIALWFWVLGVAAAAGAGCAGVQQKYPSEDVKAFFIAANEANFWSAKQCLAPHSLDLSAYAHLMDVKYPATQRVEVLSGPPARPYQPFAILEGASSPSSGIASTNLIERFKGKAREIGADAIIVCQPEGGGAASSKIEAVAIKYRAEGKSDRQ